MKNTENTGNIGNALSDMPKKRAARIAVNQLHSFEGHPFKVLDDEDMEALVESIRLQGILSPLIVRPLADRTDAYEVISGHRRLHAAIRAGLKEVPALIYPLDRNEAAIAVVDSNLHRERILPSEKAFSYKLKMEAMKHQGKTSDQLGPKLTAAFISEDESASQVKRYIRLTNLIPELLEKVDDGTIAFSPAVELSFLTEAQQRVLLEAMDLNDCTPSHAQSIRLKKIAQQNALSADDIHAIMSEEKANQKERISFPYDDIRRFFPKGYNAKDVYNAILKLVVADYQRRERQRKNRDAR